MKLDWMRPGLMHETRAVAEAAATAPHVGIDDADVIYRYILARLYNHDRCDAAVRCGIAASEAATIDRMIAGRGLRGTQQP